MTLLLTLVVISLAVAYVAYVRPLLKKNPAFKDLYEQEESFFRALARKFAGMKQRLTTALFVVAGTVVASYDQIAPLLAQNGIDAQSLASKVPPEVWPYIMIGGSLLLAYFRYLADKRANTPAPAPPVQ